MYNKLIIIGAGGYGAVIADIAMKNGYEEIAFVDDNAEGFCLGFSIIGKTDVLYGLDNSKTDFVIGVGNNKIRKMLAQKFKLNYVSLIHPTAIIGTDTSIGKGTVIMAGAIVNPNAQIGEHCIINTNSVVEHDNLLADFVHISPCAALGGTVTVGELTHIGIGAAVKNNTEICSECIIGAGAVVVKNITHKGVYVGVPAKRKESEN